MKKYRTQDREAGNVIDEFSTYEEAINAIAKYEEADKNDGTFTSNFYEVKEVELTELNSEWANDRGLVYEEKNLKNGSIFKSWNGEIEGIEVHIDATTADGRHHTVVNPSWWHGNFNHPQVLMFAANEEDIIKAINFIKSFGK